MHLAGGFTASALVLTGAFIAYKLSRPATAEARAPLTWEVAPPVSLPIAPAIAERSPVARASASGWSLRPIVMHERKARCPSSEGPVADAFQVQLEPTPETPRGYAYADALRAALAHQGAVAARPHGRVIWSVGRQFVARLDDGSRIAVLGGYGVTELSFRELTPATCRLLFGAAEGAHAYVAFPGGRADPASGEAPGVLCGRLGRAFEAWRGAAAPIAAVDLADLDRRDVSISRPGDRAGGARAGDP